MPEKNFFLAGAHFVDENCQIWIYQMHLRIKLFVLFFAFSQILVAADGKREVYQNSYSYWLLTNVIPSAYFVFGIYNQLTDENKSFTMNDAANMAGSYYIFNTCIHPVVNKIVQSLPPLVSHETTNKEKSIFSCIKKEVAGLFLGIQDLVVKAACGSVVDVLLDAKFPTSAAYDENNMDTWCRLYRNPKNFTCDAAQEISVDPEKCSIIGINLVFVPKTDLRGSGAHYITNENTRDHVKRFVAPIKGWKEKCETCNVNLWFDHLYSDEKMVTNTKKLICEQFDHNKAALKKVYFFDLRTVPMFNAYEKAFDKNVPVYPRADAARFFPEKMKDEIFVYTDLDIAPLSEKQILSPHNLAVLKDIPLAFVAAPSNKARLNFENGFFILTRTENQRDEQVLQTLFRACASRLSFYVNEKIPPHEDLIYEMIPTYCVAHKMGQMISHELNFFSDVEWARAIALYSIELGHLPTIFSKSIRDLAAHIDISDEKNYERFSKFVSAYFRNALPSLFNNIMNMASLDKKTLEDTIKIVSYFCHLKVGKGVSCCNTIEIPSSLLEERNF